MTAAGEGEVHVSIFTSALTSSLILGDKKVYEDFMDCVSCAAMILSASLSFFLKESWELFFKGAR